VLGGDGDRVQCAAGGLIFDVGGRLTLM